VCKNVFYFEIFPLPCLSHIPISVIEKPLKLPL